MARKLYPRYTMAYHAIDDAFSAARTFKDSAEQIDGRIAKIREELNSKTPAGKWRYSEYERFSAAGYIAARYNDIWRYVEFCYRDANGIIYSTHSDSSHRKTEEFYASGRGNELPKLEAAHVWKGTNRNYTPWSCRDSEPHTVSK